MTPDPSGGDRPKPISIRDAVGGSDGAGASSGGRGGARPRPRPARVGPSSTAGPADAAEPDPERRLVADEVEWTIRVAGSTRSGSSVDAGVPLLHLAITDATGQHPPREILVAAESLGGIHEEELHRLLARSRVAKQEGVD